MLPFDAIIIGGGPAGLSAALILGRCKRRVLVCDAGKQRNRASLAMHGYLTRDGIPPGDFLEIAQQEILRYGVRVRKTVVESATFKKHLFHVKQKNGGMLVSRKLLIATGVADELPDIPNVKQFYGKSVHHCPYCDGWENRNKRVAVYSKTPGLAFSLKTWTNDVVLFSNGPIRISARDRAQLDRLKIPLHRGRIARLAGAKGNMTGIVLETGETIACDSMFFSTSQHQACDIAQGLGCVLNNRGTFNTNKVEMSNIEGLYVAGDASRDVQLVIVAAAEGAKAAFAINCALQEEDGLTRPPLPKPVHRRLR